MSLSLWLSFVGLCVLGAVSPGPSLAVVLRHTISSSPRHGAVVAVTHALGVSLWALCTVTGLGQLFVEHPKAQQLIALLGGLYLLWLAVGALSSAAPKAISPEEVSVAEGERAGEPLATAAREGFLISMLNPKLALFFVALFSQLITPDLSAFDRGLLVATAGLIDGGWYLLVALTLSRSGALRWLRPRAHRLDQLSGLILLLFAARVLSELFNS